MAPLKMTVGIPPCNRPHFLQEALPSVREHDFEDFAALVCDNSSNEDSGVVTCKIRYIARTLANVARRKGLLSPERLVADAVEWPPLEASVTVVALAVDKVPARRAAAQEIYRKHPNILGKGASHHVKIAARIRTWYLRDADRLHRLRYRWPPKETK
jgi:hypothetical protein